jgi:peptidoglycan/LPS O-acetylase OafA/YrhL
MLIAIIILAWLLVSTWITLIVVGIDEGYKGNEWAGIIVACLLSPIMVFIIRPIVLTIKRAKKKKKPNECKKERQLI